MTNGWMMSLQTGTSLAAKVGVVAWLGLAHGVYRQSVRWLHRHTTAAERLTLRHVGLEAAIYAETLFSHLPVESKVQEALRYADRTMESLGIAKLEPELRAVVAWGFRQLEQTANGAMTQPPLNR